MVNGRQAQDVGGTEGGARGADSVVVKSYFDLLNHNDPNSITAWLLWLVNQKELFNGPPSL